MSSSQSKESQEALDRNRALAERYYGIALPALQARFGSINEALAAGEPAYLREAYAGQRTGLTEGLAARGSVAQAQKMLGSKAALSGGNLSATLSPADIGAQLANALYGSKFQEGQANLEQQFNLINMGLGGAGTSGSGALSASQQQLQAIGYMPNYNPTAANVFAGLSGAASAYGSLYNQGYFGGPNPSVIQSLPTGTSYSGVVGNAP